MSNKPNDQSPIRAGIRRNEAGEAILDSDRFFSALSQVSTVGIFRTDVHGNYLYVNERWCKIVGMKPGEALVGGWARAIYPDDRDRVAKAWYTSKHGQLNFILEYRIQRPDGVVRWVLGQAAAEKNLAGEVVGYLGTITDITQIKESEQSLVKSETKYHTLFDSTTDAVMLLDEKGFFDCNRAALAMYGCATMEEFCSKQPADLLLPEQPGGTDSQVLDRQLIAAAVEHGSHRFEMLCKRVDTGKLFPVEVSLTAMEMDGKQVFQATARDISERRKNEERLRQSEEKLRAYLENISDTIWLIDANLNMAYVSPSVKRLLGVLPEELIGRPSALVIHPDDMGVIDNAMQYVIAHPGEPHTVQYRVSHKDGRWIYVESTGINMLANPAINGVLVAMRDITARKRIEDELKQTNERYDFATAIGKVGTWDWNPVTNDLIWSNESFRLLEVDPASTKPSYELFLEKVHPDDRKLIEDSTQAALRDKKPYSVDFRIVSADGQTLACHAIGKVEFDANDQPIRMLGTIQDITERKQIEDALSESEASMRAILDNSPYLVWLKDSEGRYITSNLAHTNYVRLKDPREIVGKTDFDFWPKELAEKYRADDAEIMASRRQKHVEEPSIDGGRMHWVETYKTPVVDKSGNVLGTTGFSSDITDRKQAEAALLESEYRWKFALEGSGDGLWDWNVADNTVFYSKRWKEMLGYSEDEIGNSLDEWEKRLHPDDKAETVATLQAYLDGKTPVYQCEHRVKCKDGSWKWILDRGMVVSRSEEGKPLRMIGTHADITGRKHAEEQIHNLAFYDTLTQLPNRRMLNDRMNQAMAFSKRSGRYGALLFLDLDNFKPLNDTYGHAVGDLLLKEVARRISSCVREMDTVARFGGDEFVVMLTELDADKVDSSAQAGVVAEKIRIILAEPYVLRVQQEGKPETTVEHHCTSSIGVVLFIDHEHSPEDIIKWADMAMYQAKEDGRNLIRFHDSKG